MAWTLSLATGGQPVRRVWTATLSQAEEGQLARLPLELASFWVSLLSFRLNSPTYFALAFRPTLLGSCFWLRVPSGAETSPLMRTGLFPEQVAETSAQVPETSAQVAETSAQVAEGRARPVLTLLGSGFWLRTPRGAETSPLT